MQLQSYAVINEIIGRPYNKVRTASGPFNAQAMQSQLHRGWCCANIAAMPQHPRGENALGYRT